MAKLHPINFLPHFLMHYVFIDKEESKRDAEKKEREKFFIIIKKTMFQWVLRG
jgi:hypothetical protein